MDSQQILWICIANMGKHQQRMTEGNAVHGKPKKPNGKRTVMSQRPPITNKPKQQANQPTKQPTNQAQNMQITRGTCARALAKWRTTMQI